MDVGAEALPRERRLPLPTLPKLLHHSPRLDVEERAQPPTAGVIALQGPEPKLLLKVILIETPPTFRKGPAHHPIEQVVEVLPFHHLLHSPPPVRTRRSLHPPQR